VSGSTQVVNFNSNPDEASVIINGYSRGRTPLAVDLARKTKIHKVKIEKKGYNSETVILKRSLNGWVFGNLLILSPIAGPLIDFITGGIYKISPEEVIVELKEKDDTSVWE
tara:strand:+ start:278 stop:610 length:333 start_codon:yes stop_codon:yes gene_type:complete